jgi:YjbE family integral membrane protein
LTWFSEFFDPSAISVMFGQFYREVHHPQFWVALTEIIWINVLLSGDNALVIALACRGLKPRQRLWGMIFGAGAAVVLRIIFTGIVVTLMALPYLKLIGGLALIIIAAKLLVPEQDDEEVQSASHLWAAVRIVVVADIVMSLDNVIAVAAAANGSVPLLILGLAISIPLIVAGAALIMTLLDRLPILIWVGAMLLGWIAGDVVATDPAIHSRLETFFAGAFGARIDGLLASLGVTSRFAQGSGGEIACGILGVIVVLVVGTIWRRRKRRRIEHAIVLPAGEASAIDRSGGGIG